MSDILHTVGSGHKVYAFTTNTSFEKKGGLVIMTLDEVSVSLSSVPDSASLPYTSPFNFCFSSHLYNGNDNTLLSPSLCIDYLDCKFSGTGSYCPMLLNNDWPKGNND